MKKVLGWLFSAGLDLNAKLTRSRWRFVETRLLTPFFVRFTRLVRGKPARPIEPTAEALGREWRRLLGNPRTMPVVQVDEISGTAYGEIHVHCPLRGTGDVAACHRLMAYDRGLLAPLGARLVVLQSQAEPGHSYCRVALLREGAQP